MQSTGEGSPLRVKLLFERPLDECGEVCVEYVGLEQAYEGAHFDETFEVPVELPKGTFPFNAEVHAEVVPQLFDGSTFVRDQAMIDNADGEGVTFEIVVPDNVTVTSGSGKLPIVGGAQTPPTDSTPPVLNLPGLQVADATGPNGTTVTYSARATDDSGVDPARAVRAGLRHRVPDRPAPGDLQRHRRGRQSRHGYGPGPRLERRRAARLADRPRATLPRALRATLTAIAGRPKAVQCVGLRAFHVLVLSLRRTNSISAADAADVGARANRIGAVLGC
jgi:hypothetical protein